MNGVVMHIVATGSEWHETWHGKDENYHWVWAASWRNYWLWSLRHCIQGIHLLGL